MKESSKIEGKEEVPQIHSETGVSQDYANQLNGIVSGFLMKKNISFVKDMLKKQPFHMKKYGEAYVGYKNIINDKNRDRIKKLDELADKMNDILKNPDAIDEDAFLKTSNLFYSLIYGNNDNDIEKFN